MVRVRTGLAGIGKLADVAASGGLLQVARRRPRSLAAEVLVRGLSAHVAGAATLIDGGANEGQFTRAFLANYPGAHVIAFEPHPGAARRFRVHLAGEPGVTLHEVALGATRGTGALHVHADSQQSTLDPAGVEGAISSPIVGVTTLDAALAGVTVRRPCVLKLDLQGGEAAAVRGAHDLLHTGVDVLVCETTAGPEPWAELGEAIGDAPLAFAGPLALLRDRAGAVVQMDALFVRIDRDAS